jgi:hypothetical protein
MSSIITRLYRSEAEADAAGRRAPQRGFAPAAIRVTRSGSPPDVTIGSLRRGGVSPEGAARYAPLLEDGYAILTVRPPYGHAVTALGVLRPFDAVRTGIADEYESLVDPAAPFSTSMGWRVLLRNPAPLSDAIGFRALSHRQNPRVGCCARRRRCRGCCSCRCCAARRRRCRGSSRCRRWRRTRRRSPPRWGCGC